MQPYKSCLSNIISGDIPAPSDKSISHRSLLISALAIGTSRIWGLLESDDVLHLRDALEALGVKIRRSSDENLYYVEGVGLYGFKEPYQPLYMGNSGTACRLLIGGVATLKQKIFFTGDLSLSSRPMARIITPLQKMGVRFAARQDDQLPLVTIGTDKGCPIDYVLPVPSAQVKSSILLAALRVKGTTTIIEPPYVRDHTETMLASFGANIEVIQLENGFKKIVLSGQKELISNDITVSGDPSSAAFLTAAALIVPQSTLYIRNICFNSARIGFYNILGKMGANIEIIRDTVVCRERVVDILVRHSHLKATDVPAEMAPSMIDEFPILAILASQAEGRMCMNGLSELRVKESNRFQAIVAGLRRCGVAVEEKGDSMIISKKEGHINPVEVIKSYGDHRIAMSFLVLGLISHNGIVVDDISSIQTSFPNFIEIMNKIGSNITMVSHD